jgi:hypothetical protein
VLEERALGEAAHRRKLADNAALEVKKLDELLAAGAIDQQTYTRAVEDANDRALRSSRAWTDGATRFLKDYVAESQDAATAPSAPSRMLSAVPRTRWSLVGFIGGRDHLGQRVELGSGPLRIAHQALVEHYPEIRGALAHLVQSATPVTQQVDQRHAFGIE